MLIAVLVTVLGNNILGWEWIITSILIASVIGFFSARKNTNDSYASISSNI